MKKNIPRTKRDIKLIGISKPLHLQLKTIAVTRGIYLSELVEEALNGALEGMEKTTLESTKKNAVKQ